VDNDELKQLITDTAIRLRVLATEFRNARRHTMALKMFRDANTLEKYLLQTDHEPLVSESVYYHWPRASIDLGDGSRG
jgi:hypothetical protein